MILTARHVSAKEGLELGFVNEVVPAGEALAAAERWAETIAKNSPMSIRASKQAIQRGLDGVAGTGDRRAAGVSGGEGDGGLAGLHRGAEGVFGEAAAEMAGEVRSLTVIASEAKQSIEPQRKCGLLRRYAPLRKRFAFVAGNDGESHPTYSPTPFCTTRSSADRRRACPSWSARDARPAPASADRPRLLRSCPIARDSIRSTSHPSRATASAARLPLHRSPCSSASCRVTRSSALMPTRSLKALWPLMAGVISLRRKSATALISSVGVGSSCIFILLSEQAAAANRFPSPTSAGRSWRAPSNDRGRSGSAASCRST